MPPIDPARLRKIQRASRELRLLFIVLFVLTALGALTKLGHPNPHGTKVVLAGIVFQGASLTDKIHLLWVVQHVLGAGIALWIFYHLIRLLGLYSQVGSSRRRRLLSSVGLVYHCSVSLWYGS